MGNVEFCHREAILPVGNDGALPVNVALVLVVGMTECVVSVRQKELDWFTALGKK